MILLTILVFLAQIQTAQFALLLQLFALPVRQIMLWIKTQTSVSYVQAAIIITLLLWIPTAFLALTRIAQSVLLIPALYATQTTFWIIIPFAKPAQMVTTTNPPIKPANPVLLPTARNAHPLPAQSAWTTTICVILQELVKIALMVIIFLIFLECAFLAINTTARDVIHKTVWFAMKVIS